MGGRGIKNQLYLGHPIRWPNLLSWEHITFLLMCILHRSQIQKVVWDVKMIDVGT